MQRPSYNKDWACGRMLDTYTKRVDFLDKTGTMVVQPVTMDQPQAHQYDFMKGQYVTRSRDRRRNGGWHEVSV